MPSAPELVLDLLVADRGDLGSKALCRAGALMGIGETAVRVSLTRLVAAGKIARTARGAYRLEREGPALSRAVDDWRRKHAETVCWRGDWVAVHDAGVACVDKTAWRRHSLALSLRGFASLRPGLQIRPDNLRGGMPAQRLRLEALGLAPHALVFRLSGFQESDSAAARRLWDVAALQADRRRLQTGLERSERRLGTQALQVSVRESLLLGRSVIAHLVRDPLLPAEMMSPETGAALLAITQRYQNEARRLWRDWLALPGEPAEPVPRRAGPRSRLHAATDQRGP